MIGGQVELSAGRSVQLANILRAQYSSGKISLPLDGGLYARFKHVQGVPAGSNAGYSLSKLQMIDLMVERLVKLRGQAMEVPRPSSDAEAARIVESLAGELHTALEQTPVVGPGTFTQGLVERGMMFSLVA